MVAKPLPDPGSWQPHGRAAETVSSAFHQRCRMAEEEILLQAGYERRMSIQNFDSGLPLEEMVRAALRQLLPTRYSVRAGIVVDREGRTAGDCDVVIFNDLWFPAVKAGPTPESRRTYLPVEGVYAIGEIKQSLDEGSLDAAMQKLVIAHRLLRPHTERRRIAENRTFGSDSHGLSNPLYSFIFATSLGEGCDLPSLIERFFQINKQLKRLEIIRALCVLDQGCVIWGFKDERGELRPAVFMFDDLRMPISPVYFDVDACPSPLFALLENLSLHLYHSVLAPEDLVPSYGLTSRGVKVPTDPAHSVAPDPDG
jgi:hypothetical protein